MDMDRLLVKTTVGIFDFSSIRLVEKFEEGIHIYLAWETNKITLYGAEADAALKLVPFDVDISGQC